MEIKASRYVVAAVLYDAMCRIDAGEELKPFDEINGLGHMQEIVINGLEVTIIIDDEQLKKAVKSNV